MAIGQRDRQAIDHEPHTPNAKRRPRPKASNGDLEVLGVVVSVGHIDARDGRERLADVDLRAGTLDLLTGNEVDGARRIEHRLGRPTRSDHGLLEQGLRLRQRNRAAGQQPEGDDDGAPVKFSLHANPIGQRLFLRQRQNELGHCLRICI